MAVSNQKAFPPSRGSAEKAELGATDVERTPLAIRTSGLVISPQFADYVRGRLGSKLGRFATSIERLSVRFEDVNGPRGGVDIVCRAKVVLSALPSVVVEARAKTDRSAFDGLTEALTRAVRKSLDRAPAARSQRRGRATPARAARSAVALIADAGSLIGRRVGRGAQAKASALHRPEKRRRDVPVDTSAPGVSATQRKAGGNSTARRNTLGRAPRATATLEDSRKPRPSRKSTRKSANRVKSATNLQKRASARAASPQARAAKG